jgi:TM2 domain-containing membrane protein YozV
MRRSYKIAPGVRLNVSKSGFSTSTKLGPVTLNSRGRATVRVAKGLSYQSSLSARPPKGASRTATTDLDLTPDQAAFLARLPRPARKSVALAYVLWLPFGLVGAHRYYLGKTGTAIAQTLTLGGLGVWWLLDFFLIPTVAGQVNRVAYEAWLQTPLPPGLFPELEEDTTVDCPRCHAAVRLSAHFCPSCGLKRFTPPS